MEAMIPPPKTQAAEMKPRIFNSEDSIVIKAVNNVLPDMEKLIIKGGNMNISAIFAGKRPIGGIKRAGVSHPRLNVIA